MHVALLLALACAAPPQRAEPPEGWRPRPELRAGLPAGVEVLAFERAEPPLRAWCVVVDLEASALEPRVLLDHELATVGAQAATIEAPIAINGGYFGGKSSLSLALDRGQRLSSPPNVLTREGARHAAARGAFGVLEDGAFDIAWVHTVGGAPRALDAPLANRPGAPVAPEALEGAGAPWPARTAIGAGPVLVQGGAPRVTWTEELFFGSGIGAPDARQPRSAVGYTEEGRLFLLLVEGRAAASRGATLLELAEMLIALGAVEALNLDGGGSSALVVGGRRINALPDGADERPVATVLALAPTYGVSHSPPAKGGAPLSSPEESD